MLNYLKKFALDILPSVAATIIGAYIVNHYIAARPQAPAGTAQSATGTKADAKKTASRTELKSEPKADAKPDSKSVSVEPAAIPEPGVKAKGISERTMIETRAAERPAEVKPTEKPAEAKAAETKPAETKPAETASISADTHRQHAPASSRDVNDLARAAIARLRGNSESAPRAQEAARAPVPDAPRLQEAPRTVSVAPVAPPPSPVSPAPMVQPLPPAITVSGNPVEGSTPAPASPPYTASVDPNRPVPPAEIPPPPPQPPVDLRAEAANAAAHTRNVAEDVLSAAKSVFHAVLPNNGQTNGQQFTD